MDNTYTSKDLTEYIEKILFTIENDNSPFGKTLPLEMYNEYLHELGKRKVRGQELYTTRCAINIGIGLALAAYLKNLTTDIPGRTIPVACSITSVSEYFEKYPEELRKLEIYFSSHELFHLLSILDDEALRRFIAIAGETNFEDLYKAFLQGNERGFCSLIDDSDICQLSLAWCMEFSKSKSWELYINKLLENPVTRDSVIETLNSLFPNIAKILPLFFAINSSEELNPDALAMFMNNYKPALAELEYKIMNYSNLPDLTSYRKNQYTEIVKTYSFIFEDAEDEDYILPSQNPFAIMHVIYNVGRLVLKMAKEEIPASNTLQNPVACNDRLEFPSRLIYDISTAVPAQDQEPILRELYNLYGGSFEDMSCEEFLYLFGAAFVKKPVSYSPPYYWNGEESTMKALLRILYRPQPNLLKGLILHTSDKVTGETSHNWGKNKDKVSYKKIESIIIKMVHRVTGKTLKEL